MAEEVGERAGLRDGVAESVVGVGGNGFAGVIKIAGNVTVVVVERDVDGIVDRKVEESSDAARALQRTGDIRLPSMSYEGVVSHRGAVSQRLKMEVYCV